MREREADGGVSSVKKKKASGDDDDGGRTTAARICGEVVGSSTARFFYDQLLVKEVGCADRTPWHQDQPYWAVKGRQVCSI